MGEIGRPSTQRATSNDGVLHLSECITLCVTVALSQPTLIGRIDPWYSCRIDVQRTDAPFDDVLGIGADARFLGPDRFAPRRV